MRSHFVKLAQRDIKQRLYNNPCAHILSHWHKGQSSKDCTTIHALTFVKPAHICIMIDALTFVKPAHICRMVDTLILNLPKLTDSIIIE
jgi:hypothetical protein